MKDENGIETSHEDDINNGTQILKRIIHRRGGKSIYPTPILKAGVGEYFYYQTGINPDGTNLINEQRKQAKDLLKYAETNEIIMNEAGEIVRKFQEAMILPSIKRLNEIVTKELTKMNAMKSTIEVLESELEKEIDMVEYYARQLKARELVIIDLKIAINELKEIQNGMS